jgi:hypothetical protein
MGEPLATLPPSVPELRTGSVQPRPLRGQCRKRVGQGGGGSERDVVRVLLNLPQLGHAGHVQDACVLLVLLGHPQAHVGTACHHLGRRVRGARGQQLGQRGGSNIRRIGLWRFLVKREQLQFL